MGPEFLLHLLDLWLLLDLLGPALQWAPLGLWLRQTPEVLLGRWGLLAPELLLALLRLEAPVVQSGPVALSDQ